MAQIDLDHSIPEQLAESACLSDLLETVKSARHFNEREAQVLDYIYRFRVARVLGDSNPEAVQTLLDHLDRVTHPLSLKLLEKLEKDYGQRWSAYMDMLEDRLVALESRVPDALLKKTHVQPILDLLVQGTVDTQAEVRQALGLRPANLTRVLNLMEANRLIIRTTHGRKKRISIGEAGMALMEKKGRKTMVPRGASYLRLDHVA